MRATLRWAHADLRTHRGEALFIVLASAGIIGSLLLAVALFSYATNPWQRVFTQSRRAHVWLHTRAAADTTRANSSELEGVTSVAGPYPTGRRPGVPRRPGDCVELRATVGPARDAPGRWSPPAAGWTPPRRTVWCWRVPRPGPVGGAG